MSHVILVKPDQHYEYNDLNKFKEVLTKLSEQKGEDVKEVLAYFFHRHFIVYLWHLHMQTFSGMTFDGPPELLDKAIEMNSVFQEWLGEERYNELAEHARGVFKDMQKLDEEE